MIVKYSKQETRLEIIGYYDYSFPLSKSVFKDDLQFQLNIFKNNDNWDFKVNSEQKRKTINNSATIQLEASKVKNRELQKLESTIKSSRNEIKEKLIEMNESCMFDNEIELNTNE